MLEPTTMQVIFALIIGIPIILFLFICIIYYFAEERRTSRKPTKYYWAYGKRDTCNVKFVTKDYHK